VYHYFYFNPNHTTLTHSRLSNNNRYSTPQGQTVSQVAEEVGRSWVTLPEIKRLTGFGSRSYKDVLEKFASLCDDNGFVSRSSFEAVCHSLAPLSELSAQDRERLHVVHQKLFTTIDADGNGLLDYVELSSALSVLCGGSMKERANMSFSLYDLNNDGVISLDEMTRYLTSVFRVLYEADESMRIQGVSPDELAALTAKNAFEHADLNHDDVLSKEEFEEWYNSDDGQDVHQVEEIAQNMISLAEIRRLSTLDKRGLLSVLDTFANVTDHDGFIQQDDFEDIFDEFTKDTPQKDRDRLHLCLGRLYDALAGDDNLLDFQEVAVFACIMCSQDKNRTRIAFDIFDVDSSGSIDMSELQTHLEIVFKIMLALEPQHNVGVDASTLALISAEKAMKEADTSEDGKISFEEFKKWYENGGDDSKPQDDDDDDETVSA
jgi:Ca2+-binding EF-hand superfamily protein